mgnify:CR=1 FL=1
MTSTWDQIAFNISLGKYLVIGYVLYRLVKWILFRFESSSSALPPFTGQRVCCVELGVESVVVCCRHVLLVVLSVFTTLNFLRIFLFAHDRLCLNICVPFFCRKFQHWSNFPMRENNEQHKQVIRMTMTMMPRFNSSHVSTLPPVPSCAMTWWP